MNQNQTSYVPDKNDYLVQKNILSCQSCKSTNWEKVTSFKIVGAENDPEYIYQCVNCKRIIATDTVCGEGSI